MSGCTPYPRELIRASAGTGKTFQISNRIVGLLAEGVEPDSVLASTFTRKAAGEILDRVLLRLSRAALDPSEAEQLAEHALLAGRADRSMGTEEALRLLVRIVRRMHRIDVGTLDALFVRMARAFALELGLTPGWEIADGPVRDRLRSEAVQGLLEEGDPGTTAELLRIAARGQADRRVHDRLVDEVDVLHGYLLDLDPAADRPWSPFRDRERAAHPDEACRALAARLGDVEPPANRDGSPNKTWASALEDACRALRERDWESFWAKGPPAKFLTGEDEYSRKPFPEGLPALLEEVRELTAAVLAPEYERQAEALGRIARAYHEALRTVQRRASAYGFRDVAQLLGGSEPVAGRPDLHHRLDRRSEHVLLDEFQDTSTPQWIALRPIVDRVAAAGRPDRSLVVVADSKQSIYGWRGADPEIVDRVERLYDLEAASLRHSWRSSPVVLDFVNRVFGSIEDNPVVRSLEGGTEVVRKWSDAYERHEPAPPLADQPGHVTVQVGPEDEGRGVDRPELMRCAARRVAELHRTTPGATVGVLVRRNRTVARLIHELRRHGIEASEEGGTTVDDAAPVAALLALLRLADHPGHRIARYHVAASPLGAAVDFTDHEDDQAARRLAARVRTRLVSEGYGPMLSSMVEDLAPSVSPAELRRLEQLVELGFRWEGRSTLRPGDFVRFVESEKVEDPLSMPVRVMTVHQAKGLEFDVVMLPELDDSISRGEVKTALPERDPETGRVRRIFPAVEAAFRPLFPEMQTALAQNRDDAIRDELSWLYVGVTRARFSLHLMMGERGGSSTAKSFARLVTAAVGRQGEDVAEGDLLFESGDRSWHRGVEGVEEGPDRPDPEEIELRIDPAAPRTRLFAQRTPSAMESGGKVDPARVLRVETVGALRRGDVVHRWCEEVRWIDEGLPTVDRLCELARSVVPAMGGSEVERLAREYRRWMRDPAVSEILDRDATEARLARLADEVQEVRVLTERPFAVRRDDDVVSGVIDRLVLARDGGGEVVAAELADYKTDRLDPGGEPAIAERLEAYRPQLLAYRDAVARIYRLEASRVVARLVFLEPGVTRTPG